MKKLITIFCLSSALVLTGCKGNTQFTSNKNAIDGEGASNLIPNPENPDVPPIFENEPPITNPGDPDDDGPLKIAVTPGEETSEPGGGLSGSNGSDNGEDVIHYSTLTIEVSSRVDQGTNISITGVKGNTKSFDISGPNQSFTFDDACFEDKDSVVTMLFNGQSANKGSEVTALEIPGSSSDEVQIGHESKAGRGYANNYEPVDLNKVDDVVFKIFCETQSLSVKDLKEGQNCSYNDVVDDDC